MSTTSGAAVHGHVEDGWGKVADAFRANFEGDPGELGAACCVYVGSRPVVDLWSGQADSETKRPWNEDTIALVASTTKGATAICAHMLAQRGELDLDAPVIEYWPEFGANGKDKIPVRWLLAPGRSAGPRRTADLRRRRRLGSGDPRDRGAEAAVGAGYGARLPQHELRVFVGEVVRRITGKSLSRFFADEVAGPLGLNAWIGLPEEQEGKVARIEYAKPFTLEEMTKGMIETTGLDAATVTAWINAVWGEGSVRHAPARSVAPSITPRSTTPTCVRTALRRSRPRTCSRTRDRWHGCTPPR